MACSPQPADGVEGVVHFVGGVVVLCVQDRGGAVRAGECDLQVADVGAADRDVGDDVLDDDVFRHFEGDVDAGGVVVGDVDRLLDDARIERHLRGDRRPVEGGVDHADRVELTKAEVVIDRDTPPLVVQSELVSSTGSAASTIRCWTSRREFGLASRQSDEARGERSRGTGAPKLKV